MVSHKIIHYGKEQIGGPKIKSESVCYFPCGLSHVKNLFNYETAELFRITACGTGRLTISSLKC